VKGSHLKERNLKVIKGGLQITHKSAWLFSSAFATNTRLMGVFVVYIHWAAERPASDSELHQFFYIDAEEFGLESYRGLSDNNADALYEAEQSMLGGLGGTKSDLSEKEAIFLIQKYAALAKSNGALPAGKEEFSFILARPAVLAPLEEIALFYKLCVPLETNEQLINYFLMRYFSKDLEAIRHLSVKPMSMSAAPNKHSETLCKNTIEPYVNPSGTSFLCESLIENSNRYQLILSEIYLNGKKISHFNIRSCFFVSASEAAMMLGRPEYITVYELLGDVNETHKAIAKLYPGALQKMQEGGCLFLQFKNNNDHLKEAVYRLNDDIRGLFYITEYGQLIAVAYSLLAINRIEKELQMAIGATIVPTAKYEFKESVFYEFMQGEFTEFSEFMEYLNEFDPEE
jgi:hypothetical protein